jgi:glucokinase
VARWIGFGLVNTVAFFTPDVIVLGGGVGTRCFALLAPTIRRVLEDHGRLVPTSVALFPAQTGDNAGVLGAALRALNASAHSRTASDANRRLQREEAPAPAD